jgi:hypothetical protein
MATTRKTTAKNTTESKAPEPMDATIRETAEPVAALPNQRLAYAAKTLLAEVADLFPDATYVEGERNGRGVLIGLTFEMASLTDDDAADLANLLTLLHDPAHNVDGRIEDVTHDEPEHLIAVTFRNQPTIYDSRAPFGLADALSVLAGSPDDDEGISFGGSL